MIACIFDPELFSDDPDARNALSEHITSLKTEPNIIIRGSLTYFEELEKQILSCSKPSLRYALFGMLNKKRQIIELVITNEAEIRIQHVKQLLCKLTDEERAIWIPLIQNLISYEIAHKQTEDEIVLATWWKPELVVRDANKNIIFKKLWCLEINFDENDENTVKAFILCSQRNWEKRWTSRYADELPDIEDQNGGDFPFCYPREWCELAVVKVTKNSREGWQDSFGNVWAESAPGRHGRKHWDVQLCSQFCKQYSSKNHKCEHLNINKWGTDKKPGDINHGHQPGSGWKKECLRNH